jgi:glycosyltransferase involved in cell wall biosynthesis
MREKASISYFLSHPIQYISPLLEEMAKTFDLQVYYFSDASIKGAIDKGFAKVIKWDIPLLQGYKYTFIPNNSPSPGLSNRFFNLVNFGLIKSLKKDPSSIIIVNGWAYFSSILTIITARMLGKKVWLRGENPLSQEVRKNKKLLLLKNIMLRQFLFRFVNRFLYIGKESKRFFEFYGAKPNQLVYTPYGVDNNFFDAKYEILKHNTVSLKSRLGLPINKLIILFSGKYIYQKRPLDLLKAFKELNDTRAALVMVGEGELRNKMEAYIAFHNLSNVYLTGFINQSKIPEYYMVADIFVMCSGAGETWGLSVNEAMNFAKPVVVTDTCGCSSDLVEHNRNGFIVEEGNINQLTGALRQLLLNEQFRIEAGMFSKQKVKAYSISTIVENLKAASS